MSLNNIVREITAASVEGTADAVRDILSTNVNEDFTREWMKTWVAYAEDGPSFDPKGKYLCGTCAVRIDNGKRNGNECAPMTGVISLEAGSCRMYIHGPDKEETKPYKHRLTQIEAQYGERPETKAFGCARCEYGVKVDNPDKDGRTMQCKYFNMVHVEPLACCSMNEGDDSIEAPGDKKDIEAGGPGSGRRKGWGKETELALSKLIPTQEFINKDYVKKYLSIPYEDRELPKVLNIDGKYFINGGHHRVAAAKQEGRDTIKVLVKEIKAASETSLAGDQKGTLWHHVRITGFTGPEEEGLRAMLSRVPPELLFNVVKIEAAKELGAKHGRYVPETKVMMFNPENFNLRQRFGKGAYGWVLHPELTIVHEIGHSIYESFTPEKQKEWQDLSHWMKGWKTGQSLPYQEKRPGWGDKKSDWTHKAGIKFTRHYAERNANEDFADCFAFSILGFGHQMELSKREFVENYFKETIKAYPQASIQSPSKPYAERSPTPKSPISDKTSSNLYNNINAGGSGSGRHKETERADRAKATYVAQTRERFRLAALSEQIIAKAIGGKVTGMEDGKWHPFDIIKGKIGIEVKTILPGAKNDKLTMHKSSLARKVQTAKDLGFKKAYTVCVDIRNKNSIGVYVKSGLGSFRLGSMKDVGSFNNLKKHIR